MIDSDTPVWLIILCLGLGTFLIRFSFLGLLGGTQLPEWVLRNLRYTPVAILPGLVAPMVIAPDGSADPVELAAAITALAAGVVTRNVVLAMLAGVAVYALGLWLS
jgi:branched-subunit amino acid transport protein